jgi:DNA-binding CsgD family transcriptional regulator
MGKTQKPQPKGRRPGLAKAPAGTGPTRATISRYAIGGVSFIVLSAQAAVKPAWVTRLTPAEQAVLSLVAKGMSNSQMAAARGSGIPTIAKQVAALKRKTGCAERHALARLARRLLRGEASPEGDRVDRWGRGESS